MGSCLREEIEDLSRSSCVMKVMLQLTNSWSNECWSLKKKPHYLRIVEADILYLQKTANVIILSLTDVLTMSSALIFSCIH